MHHPAAVREGRGFSLIEVLVATSIMVVGVGALAQLLVVAIASNYRAKTETFASILAREKMEELRAARGANGPELGPSPPEALDRNTPGYCDFVDANGNVLDGGVAPPGAAVFVRRWSVEPLGADPEHALVLRVLVSHVSHSHLGSGQSGGRRVVDASLASVKRRKPL